jgi:nucleoside-diphosphate-sugar epimerase
MPIMGKVAFITGANGITGSAILEYLIQTTNSEQWSKIIITSRSPFKSTISDPRVEFIALDFSQKPEILAEKMCWVCKEVTHAYFASYVHVDDFAELNTANRSLFENFLNALLEVSPDLENCTLQTGGKYYNLHLYPVPTPAREEEPRREASIDNFYFPQEDFLIAKQKGERWSWNIIRPEAIIGTTNKPNGMNSALTYALYILVCKELGHEAKMPTNQIYWNGTDNSSYAPLIADLTIFVSTNPKCANEAFNIVNGDHFCWRYMWPRVAAYFGARASSEQNFEKPFPTPGVPQLELSFAEWAKDKRPVWDRICDKAGVPQAKSTWDAGTWAYQDWVFQRTWSATLSINKARKFGWTGHMDSYEAFVKTFEKMKALKQIPD